MKRAFKTVLILATIICVMAGIGYYCFTQIDFIGRKDPKTVEANVKRWNNTLLSAEYRNGTDYCEVDLLDSTNIVINVGNDAGGLILNEEYKMSKDTIVIVGGMEHAQDYLSSNKFLIQNNKLLFKKNSAGAFDTTTVMTIKFNKLKL
jgi:hypothetical protein